MRKRRQFPVLGEAQAQRAGNLLHRLGLRTPTDTADGETHGDRGPDAGVKQIGLEVNLAVGDRNHVRRNVRGEVAFLCFDDRQCRQRPAALRVEGIELRRVHIQFGGALEQPAVQIKDIPWERFAARRPAQQQRNLPIGNRVLGKIVINDQRVLAIIAEVFAHRRAGIRRHELHRGRIAGRGADDDGVIHRTGLLQRLHHTDDGGFFLADGDVDALHVAPFLIDNGVDADGRLAGLAVADDELALAAADRNHRIDGF